jgi:hypothetical protein
VPSSALDLSDTLDREWFALGMEAPPCAVYVVRSDSMPLPSHQGDASSWSFVDLTPSGPVSTAAPLPAPVPKVVTA